MDRKMEQGDQDGMAVRDSAVAKRTPAAAPAILTAEAMARFKPITAVDGETILEWIQDGRR
jgi:hypothetical protein